MTGITRIALVFVMAVAAVVGALGCGERSTFVAKDALPLADGAVIVSSIRVLGVDNGGDINVLAVTGKARMMSDSELLLAEEHAFRDQGWERRHSELPNAVGYVLDGVGATVAIVRGTGKNETWVTPRMTRTVAELQRAKRPIVIATLTPHRE